MKTTPSPRRPPPSRPRPYGRPVETHCAVHIACGSRHSVVVDSLGAAWTWGGEGRSFLGHGETGIGFDYGGERAKAEAQARAMGSSAGRFVEAKARGGVEGWATTARLVDFICVSWD